MRLLLVRIFYHLLTPIVVFSPRTLFTVRRMLPWDPMSLFLLPHLQGTLPCASMYIGEHLRLLLALVSIQVQEYVFFSCAAFLLRIVSWVSHPGQICTAVRHLTPRVLLAGHYGSGAGSSAAALDGHR